MADDLWASYGFYFPKEKSLLFSRDSEPAYTRREERSNNAAVEEEGWDAPSRLLPPGGNHGWQFGVLHDLGAHVYIFGLKHILSA